MTRLLRSALVCLAILLTFHTPAHAQGGCVNGGSGGCSTSAPEIDPSITAGSLTFFAGTALLLHSRRPRR